MSQEWGSAIIVDVIHSAYRNKRWAEIKLHGDMTLDSLKNMLHYRTGSFLSSMDLYAYYRGNEKEGFVLGTDDTKTLSSLGLQSGMEILVIGDIIGPVDDEDTTNPTSSEKLFTLTDEDYEKRPDNARKFISRIRAQQEKIKQCVTDAPPTVPSASVLRPGMRCEVLSVGGVRGEILSIGPRPRVKGEWIALKLDEPLGNSSIAGCEEGYGCYISVVDWGKKINVGDYPAIDLMDYV